MSSTVLVLGAAGRLGQVLVDAFAAAGWQVRAQARRPLPGAPRARVSLQRCDALDAGALADAALGCSVIVNALNPLYTEWDRLALPLADAALAAARSSGALLMLPGNVYNFGSRLPSLLTTETPECGDLPKARTRIEIEARLAAAATDGVDSIVIRAGDFFGGPGRGTWVDLAMTTRLARRRFVYPGPLDVPHAWAYLPDLAEVFVRVAALRAGLHGHRRVHFSGHTLTGEDFKRGVETLVGLPLRAAGLPWGFIRLASPVMPMWRELCAMRYLWQRPHALDDASLRALIGAPPATPFPDALRHALAEIGVESPAGPAVAA
ncbi:MAG: NAD(P)H-binding protein [Proteobacteria bacterium]|nr:NAD(P)H-binding protein [Pseudomonadota bacterium]